MSRPWSLERCHGSLCHGANWMCAEWVCAIFISHEVLPGPGGHFGRVYMNNF